MGSDLKPSYAVRTFTFEIFVNDRELIDNRYKQNRARDG